MKKTLLFSLIAMLMVGMSACRYDEGPLVSIKSKEERIYNTWVPISATVNTENVLNTDGTGASIVGGGTTGIEPAIKEVSFLKTNQCLFIFRANNQDSPSTGAWELTKDKAFIKVNVNFPSPALFQQLMEWEILRLNENKLKVSYLYLSALYELEFASKE